MSLPPAPPWQLLWDSTSTLRYCGQFQGAGGIRGQAGDLLLEANASPRLAPPAGSRSQVWWSQETGCKVTTWGCPSALSQGPNRAAPLLCPCNLDAPRRPRALLSLLFFLLREPHPSWHAGSPSPRSQPPTV